MGGVRQAIGSRPGSLGRAGPGGSEPWSPPDEGLLDSGDGNLARLDPGEEGFDGMRGAEVALRGHV